MNNKANTTLNIQQSIKLFEKIILAKKKEHLTVIVALSGGPDSVLLLELLLLLAKKIPQKLTVAAAAHLNHGWRDAAHKDEEFCKELCAHHKIVCEVGYGNNIETHRSHKGSQEDEGRHKRRIFFEQCRKKYQADLVALGHHQDDQVETFFIRLARGTSLEGLGCMRPWSDPYVRPLLSLRKKEIVELCSSHKFRFVEDESNTNQSFLRNRIRHHLLPLLPTIDPRLDKTIVHTIEQLQQDQNLLKTLTKKLFDEVFTHNSHSYVGNKKLLFTHPERMQQRLVMMWLIKESVPFTPSLGKINEILRFIRSPHGGSHNLHQKWILEKKQQLFRILLK